MDTLQKAANPARPRKVKGRVEINIQRCKGCELCVQACREKAISLGGFINIKGYRYAIANNDLCTGCVNCALVCPDAVITVYRTRVDKKRENIAPPDIQDQLKLLAAATNIQDHDN